MVDNSNVFLLLGSTLINWDTHFNTFTYSIAFNHLCVCEDDPVPEQPQRVVGSKGGEQVHVQRDSGTF